MARTIKESALHRRARKARTQARFLLRSWLAGQRTVPAGALQSASQLLSRHHSASTLPAAVRKRQQIVAMAATNSGGWWCGWCKRHAKQSATFCPSCGKHWQQCFAEASYAAPRQEAPWRDSWQEEPRSPRKRQYPSPRRRGKQGGKGKGQDGKEGKGQGGGKNPQSADKAPVPPRLDGLPAAPTTPSVATPKKPGGEVTPSPEKAQLDALLGVLSASASTLPPAAQQMLATLQENQTQNTTKAMHRAVAEQSRARQALHKVQTQRATYLQAWHDYLAQLATLLEQQLQEQSQVLEQMDQSELMWVSAEQSATQALAKMTGAEKDAEGSEKELEESDAMVDAAVELEAKLRTATAESQQSAERMITALSEMKQKAEEQMQQAKRDGSRTPRRGAKNEAQSEADAKAGGLGSKASAGDGGKPAVPGQARP